MLSFKKKLLCNCLKSFLQSLSLSWISCEEMQEATPGDVILILGEGDLGQLNNCKAILQMKHFSLSL